MPRTPAPKFMLIGDSQYQERQLVTSRVERTRAITAQGFAHQKTEVARNDPVDGFDPTNMEHQMGRPLWWKNLVTRLQQANPNLQFQDSPSAPDTVIALLYPAVDVEPDGGRKNVLRFLCAFDKRVLPEYSVHLPTYDHNFDPERRDYVRTLKTTKRIRGWREVLMMCLRSRLLRQSDVDLLFPQGHIRKSWWEQEKAGPIERKTQPPFITLAS